MEKRDALTPMLRRAFGGAGSSSEATRVISAAAGDGADSILRKTLLKGTGAEAAKDANAAVGGDADPNLRPPKLDSGDEEKESGEFDEVKTMKEKAEKGR